MRASGRYYEHGSQTRRNDTGNKTVESCSPGNGFQISKDRLRKADQENEEAACRIQILSGGKTSMKKCCGNCGWNCCEAVGGRFKFYCGNEESEMAGTPTDFEDTCDEWKEKDND